MNKKMLVITAVSLATSSANGLAQGGAPRAAIYITDEEVQKVNAAPGTDRQLRIVDMGTYQLAVGVVHRGPTGAARGAGGGRGAAAAEAPVRCGATPLPPGVTPSGVTGIAHDATTETYIITSGGGTLVTGGQIVNGTRSAPESQVTTVLNGPSCSGAIEGNSVQRVVKTGDIIIIPAGVPHGWTDIADHVDYLSVRPDPDKVLQRGYVHPLIAKGGGR